MKCVICKKGISEGLTLYRINAKGVAGLWACTKHVAHTDAPPLDPDLVHLVETIGQTALIIPAAAGKK